MSARACFVLSLMSMVVAFAGCKQITPRQAMEHAWTKSVESQEFATDVDTAFQERMEKYFQDKFTKCFNNAYELRLGPEFAKINKSINDINVSIENIYKELALCAKTEAVNAEVTQINIKIGTDIDSAKTVLRDEIKGGNDKQDETIRNNRADAEKALEGHIAKNYGEDGDIPKINTAIVKLKDEDLKIDGVAKEAKKTAEESKEIVINEVKKIKEFKDKIDQAITDFEIKFNNRADKTEGTVTEALDTLDNELAKLAEMLRTLSLKLKESSKSPGTGGGGN